jgi:uncharacterized protein (DUF2141 family)
MAFSIQRLVVKAAVLALVVLPASHSSADAPPTGAVTVRVSGLHSKDGQVGCALYGSAKGYPKDASAALESRFCPIDKNSSVCVFRPVPAGTYAIACFHDENGKLDTEPVRHPKRGRLRVQRGDGDAGATEFQ